MKSWLAGITFTALLFSPLTVQADPGLEYFEKKVRPVLVEHCYSCHSSEAKKNRGGLAVDTREALLEGGDSGPALILGKPGESLLIKAITYQDSDLRMPPKGKLSAEQIADLRKWVEMGAPDPRSGKIAKTGGGYPALDQAKTFWAYQPLKKPAEPKVNDVGWARARIDRFTLAKMEEKGLKPGRDADRPTLLRRVYFALIGMPPAPEQIDAFVKDTAPDAFEKVVDGLLRSPHYGERWGRFWLDVARYADSSGGGRSLIFKDAWRFRDYVIQAFNQDLPFNQFIVEQIAGDLLEGKTPEEKRRFLIATAFLLLGPTNYEGQDKPLLEMDIIDEQIDTIGKAFLGMTIGCARCHDHKFDPIPTRDYYSLAGIFKSTKFIVHSNVSRWHEMPLPAQGNEALAIKKHEDAVNALKARIAAVKAQEARSGKTGESEGVLVKGVLDPKTLPGIVVDDEDAKRVGPWKHSIYSGNFIGKGYHYDDRAAKVEKTLTFQPDFPKSGNYEVRLAYVASTNRAKNVPVRIFHANGDDNVVVNQQKTPPIEGRWVSLGTYRFVKGSQWFVMVSTEGVNGHVAVDAVQFLPEEAEAPIAKVPNSSVEDTGSGKDILSSKDLEVQLKKLIAAGPERALAMAVKDAEKIEDCHICIRGNLRNQGETAPRGFLRALPLEQPKIGKNESGRRQLAQWLASPENPLTLRVTVNRIWHHLFGVGIVRTVDNFGFTGEMPSHPELLDYLAGRFVEEGWSFKKLIREIVLSHTYQLASDPLPESAKADPENRLLSRFHRRRLDAEAIRDTILLVSGNLDKTMGGPSFPKTLAAERTFEFTDARRSVYTPVFRNKMLELFEVFDFADPNVCNGRRNISTVSTQALFLMNSPFIMDQAKLAAQKLLKSSPASDADLLDQAYQTALGRRPSAGETAIALKFLGQATNRLDGWERIYQALFACIDFRYVN